MSANNRTGTNHSYYRSSLRYSHYCGASAVLWVGSATPFRLVIRSALGTVEKLAWLVPSEQVVNRITTTVVAILAPNVAAPPVYHVLIGQPVAAVIHQVSQGSLYGGERVCHAGLLFHDAWTAISRSRPSLARPARRTPDRAIPIAHARKRLPA